MERFYIITNIKKDPDQSFTKKVMDYLLLSGKKCFVIPSDAYENRKRISTKLDPEKDCVIVIGGDGSVIRAAHLTLGSGVPILGINLGTLGYLAEVERSNWREMLSLLLNGAYIIEPRLMLEGRMIGRGGQEEADGRVLHALNEAVTGSTAYNMSAGGPLVEPKAQLMLLTPICPHTLNTRSVVLSAEDKIEIEMVRTTRNEEIKAEAVFDGGSSFPLQYGDRIEIRRSEEVTNVVKLSHKSFLSTLHKKLSS